jgi:lipopolysaccharide export system protein LptA
MRKKKIFNRIWMIMGRMQLRALPVFLVFAIASGAEAWGQSEPALNTGKDEAAKTTRAPGKQGEPISIIADRLEVDNKVSQAHFIGHVRAQQSDITLYADNLTVIYSSEKPQDQSLSGQKKAEQLLPGGGEGEKIEKIIARGNVRFIQGNRTAEGEEAVFFSTERKVVLTGNPIIRQARDHISGDRVTIFLDKEISIVEGKGTARVQAVIYPEKGVKGSP